MLEARAQVTGRERQEIVRDILHDWAVREIRTASIAHRYMLAEGLEGIDDGGSGKSREGQG